MFALIAGLATLPQFAGSRGRERLLGGRLLGNLSMAVWIVLAVVVSALLGWFFSMAQSGGADDYATVSIVSAIAFAVLLAATGLLDGSRDTAILEPEGATRSLARAPWAALMVLVIGAMMTIQVFADLEVGWFDVDGYSSLVGGYATSTGAPAWWASFLQFVADNAAIFMPLQAVAEFSCAFFLVTLLIRPVTLFATFGFFFTLMFSEFGVSATIKAGSENTWEWEMLFVTGVLLMLALVHTGRIVQQRGGKERFLGDKFFLKMSLPWQVVAAVVAAGALWAVGTQTKMFGSGYATISWRGGLYFFGCFLVLIFIDRYRKQDWEIRTDRVWAS